MKIDVEVDELPGDKEGLQVGEVSTFDLFLKKGIYEKKEIFKSH